MTNETSPSATTFNGIDAMVDRFLSWKLPEDFHPDAGISFTPHFNVEWNAKQGKPPDRHDPIGTNLFTATQAKAMLEHVTAPLRAALDQESDIRADRETMLQAIQDALGVAAEPHQTYWERLLEAAQRSVASHGGKLGRGEICKSHGLAVLVTHVNDGKPCEDYLHATPSVAPTEKRRDTPEDAAWSERYHNLAYAVDRLYFAAYWHADRPVDEQRLWTAVRDASGIAPGQTAKVLGDDRTSPSTQRTSDAIELLRRVRKANVIFPSMCANNTEAMNLLDEIDNLLASTSAQGSIDPLRQALEWYGDRRNWLPRFQQDRKPIPLPSFVQEDEGRRARGALSATALKGKDG